MDPVRADEAGQGVRWTTRKVHITESGKSLELVVLRKAAERIEVVIGEGARSGVSSVRSPRSVTAYLWGARGWGGRSSTNAVATKFELILTGSTRPCAYRDSIDCDSCSQAIRCYLTWVASLPGSTRPQRDVPRIRVFAMGRSRPGAVIAGTARPRFRAAGLHSTAAICRDVAHIVLGEGGHCEHQDDCCEESCSGHCVESYHRAFRAGAIFLLEIGTLRTSGLRRRCLPGGIASTPPW